MKNCWVFVCRSHKPPNKGNVAMQHIHFVGLRFQHLVKRAEIFTHTLFHIAMIVILAQRLVVDSYSDAWKN